MVLVSFHPLNISTEGAAAQEYNIEYKNVPRGDLGRIDQSTLITLKVLALIYVTSTSFTFVHSASKMIRTLAHQNETVSETSTSDTKNLLDFNLIKSANKRTVSKCLPFKELVLEKIDMEDECLIKYIRKLKLFRPSRLLYNFTNVRKNVQQSVSTEIGPVQSIIQNNGAPWIEALIATEILVPKEGQRHFLEYRAFDGLTFSATLHLERFLKWTGVLIEPDDKLYSEMESVHRKSYGVHACISPNKHPCKAFIKPLLNSIPKGA
ncbi:hypothetical protein QYM36_018525, partial [Artemia franciscana]